MRVLDHEHRMEHRRDASGPYRRCTRDNCQLEQDYPDPRSMVVEFDEFANAAKRG